MKNKILSVILVCLIVVFTYAKAIYSSDNKEYKDHYNKGVKLIDRKEYEKAITELTIAVRLKPKSAEAHLKLGIAYNNSRNVNNAIIELKEAIRLKPNYAIAHLKLGISYINAGDQNNAIIEIQNSIRLNPNDVDCYYHLCYAYLQQDEYEKALLSYNEMLRFTPINNDYIANSKLAFGNYLLNKNDFRRAIIEYKEATNILHYFPSAHYNLGIAYTSNKEIQKAIKEYKVAIKQKPGYANAHYNLGSIFYNLNQYDNAIFEFNKVLIIDPSDEEAAKLKDKAESVKFIYQFSSKVMLVTLVTVIVSISWWFIKKRKVLQLQ